MSDVLIVPSLTDDYSSHIQQAINDVCQTYSLYHHLQTITVPTSSKPSMMYVRRTHCTITSLYHHLPEAAVVSQVVNHLTCTMSDRVAVNHCVVEKLQSDLDIQLLELKCNVYPLEGISKKCWDVLKQCNLQYKE